MNIEIIEVKELGAYVSEVNNFHSSIGSLHGDLWFRGVNNSQRSLLPGTLWRNLDMRVEDTIVSEFLCHSPPLLESKPHNPWQQYALMQHYGLPTRLLDWSKSPLIALYFAVSTESKHERAVWCIDPFALNRYTVDKDTIFTPDSMPEDDGINTLNYLPKCMRNNQSSSIPPLPIAIEPPFTNRRIFAQQGCFTIHGTKDTSIDQIYSDNFPQYMRKFTVSNVNASKLLEQLHDMGIKEDAVYQDLNSLSARIVREFCN
ncbi:FRG domain-containing protein [Vibrio cholerae]|nr:FRG domain-containing protein [Vibrio cholerae]